LFEPSPEWALNSGFLSFFAGIFMAQDSQNLIWIDLEMTGLDPQNDSIIEIATVVTDKDLHVLAEGPVLAIHQSEAVLERMDDWNRKHHGESGLIARVRESCMNEAEAERMTVEFLQPFVPAGASPMCGNSICQDRRFLARSMPRLEAFFHYRNLDVSTLKELAGRWAPAVKDGFKKKNSHRALDDILESIAELRYYRQHILRI
jgi:oligoribonuclease